MTARRLIGWILVLGLLAFPLSVLAQDGDEPEVEEHVSEDGLLRVMVPAGWVEGDFSGLPFPNALFVNSEELAARVENEEDVIAGDKGVFAVVIPLEVFAMFGEPIPEDATLTELGTMVASIFGSAPEDATEEELAAFSLGEAEEVTLDDGRTIAAVEASTLYEDGVYFVVPLGEGLVGLVYTVAATSEFDEAQRQLGHEAAASLSYEGTAEDILAAMMAPPDVQESDVDPAQLDGNALVEERCTVCHTRERIDAAEKDLEGWTATVDRMIGYGAQLDSAERLAVIHFLAGVPLEGEAGMGDTGSEPAQEEGEFEEYVSEDGLLTLSHPAGWITNPDSFLYGVEILNSQELADQMQAVEEGGSLPAGAAITFVTVVSIDIFNMFGIPVEAGMSLEEVAQVFLDNFTAGPAGPPPGEEGEGEEPGMQMEPSVVGEIQTTEFADGRQAVWARVEYPGESDDIYVLFEAGDGIYVVVNYFTPPGELTDEQIETGLRIAESIQFTGTAEDLAMAPPDVEESEVDPATLDGNALVDERCTVCHTRERIDAADKDEPGWTATVDRMIGYGAQLNSAERQAVIDYLVATH